MHTGGFCSWINKNTPDNVYLIHPDKDGQAEVYSDVNELKNITYKKSRLEKLHVLAMLIMRTIYGSVKVSPPQTTNPRVFVAGSHFIADVIPVTYHANRRSDYKVVYIHHIIQDMPRQKNIRNFTASQLEKLCFSIIKRRYDLIITVNDEVTAKLKLMGFPQKIFTSSNFVDAPSIPVKPIERKTYDLVFCGRIVPQKGIYDFIKIVEGIQKKQPDMRAAMIGAGPESNQIRKLIVDKHLPIDFIGRADDRVKYETIANSKLFLFPSIEEGWGIVIAESFAVGTPVVAYDLPVYREVFKGNVSSGPLNDTLRLQELSVECLRSSSTDYSDQQKALMEFARQFQLEKVINDEYKLIKKDTC
jgi:glycosyltransferase involved in cell wall biosynthesis